MGKQINSMSISIFSTLTMWHGRLQKPKESCKTPTVVVRKGHRIGTSMLTSTKNSMPLWRALQFMATVTWTMAPNLLLSPRHQEPWVGGFSQCCPCPTREVWNGFWCYHVLSGPNGHKKAWSCNQSQLWKPEVSQWGLWWKKNARSIPRKSGTLWLRNSRCKFASSVINKASSTSQAD